MKNTNSNCSKSRRRNRSKKGGNASNHALQVYGPADQHTSRGSDNTIAMTGGNASDYALQVYGNSDQQTSRGFDNVIAMNGGSAHLPLSPEQFPKDSLLNPSQTEVLLSNNTSAHSGTDALEKTITGGGQKGAGLTEMMVPVSIVAINEAIKKYMGKTGDSVMKGGDADMNNKMMSMMAENEKMMAQTQCQQAGYPAQISNAPYGSSIAVAAADCNTTITGGGKRTKRRSIKKRKTHKKRGKKSRKH